MNMFEVKHKTNLQMNYNFSTHNESVWRRPMCELNCEYKMSLKKQSPPKKWWQLWHTNLQFK